jgi:hypothetical protein
MMASTHVRLSVVVQKATQAMTFVFVGSLILWVFTDFTMVNPFVSILGLSACPFFYLMAKKL